MRVARKRQKVDEGGFYLSGPGITDVTGVVGGKYTLYSLATTKAAKASREGREERFEIRDLVTNVMAGYVRSLIPSPSSPLVVEVISV